MGNSAPNGQRVGRFKIFLNLFLNMNIPYCVFFSFYLNERYMSGVSFIKVKVIYVESMSSLLYKGSILAY